MVDARQLRRVLLIDAALTALAGLLLALRPGPLALASSVDDRLAILEHATVGRLVGVVVAVFGVSKGIVYASLFDRYGPDLSDDSR